MSDLRQAAQRALKAMEDGEYRADMIEFSDALIALRAALAEPEQEPVAWAVYDILHGGSKTLHWPEQHSPNGDPKQYKAVPLFTAPTPRKPLTDEEIDRITDQQWGQDNHKPIYAAHRAYARAIEAKLKEKNA